MEWVTGDATAGHGGAITVAVGDGDSGDGGRTAVGFAVECIVEVTAAGGDDDNQSGKCPGDGSIRVWHGRSSRGCSSSYDRIHCLCGRRLEASRNRIG